MVEKYFEEDSLSPYKKGYKWRLSLLIVFLFILGLLVYTTFFSNGLFTGNAIEENVTASKLIKFDAELSTPPLELEGNFNKIGIEGRLASIYVGGQKFSLSELSNNYLSIENYDGKIYFDRWGISKLDGKASRVFVNGVPISLDSGKKIKVYFGEVSNYDSLEIENTAFVNKLDYFASGKIALNGGKNKIDVNNEEVVINKFQGSLEGDKTQFKFDGYISRLEILGDSGVVVGG